MGGLLQSDLLRLLYASLLFSSLGCEILEPEGLATNKMSFDIRRCSRDDLDKLNEDARVWRERGDQSAQEPLPEPIRVEPLANMQDLAGDYPTRATQPFRHRATVSENRSQKANLGSSLRDCTAAED